MRGMWLVRRITYLGLLVTLAVGVVVALARDSTRLVRS
jgi:hypothetical protein